MKNKTEKIRNLKEKFRKPTIWIKQVSKKENTHTKRKRHRGNNQWNNSREHPITRIWVSRFKKPIKCDTNGWKWAQTKMHLCDISELWDKVKIQGEKQRLFTKSDMKVTLNYKHTANQRQGSNAFLTFDRKLFPTYKSTSNIKEE